MFENIEKYRLVLASGSPRRSDLLRAAGLRFEVMTTNVDETVPDGMAAKEVAGHLALVKASVLNDFNDNRLYITADTTVVLENTVLGKPEDEKAAREMLKHLSGKWHEVITGVCLKSCDKTVLFSETTNVLFAQLTTEQIDYYINNFKPFDKAGAYGIQEWIGMTGIKRIEGDYFNVVGMPVRKLFENLMAF